MKIHTVLAAHKKCRAASVPKNRRRSGTSLNRRRGGAFPRKQKKWRKIQMEKIRGCRWSWRPHPPHYLGGGPARETCLFFTHARQKKAKKKKENNERQKFKQQIRGFFFASLTLFMMTIRRCCCRRHVAIKLSVNNKQAFPLIQVFPLKIPKQPPSTFGVSFVVCWEDSVAGNPGAKSHSV